MAHLAGTSGDCIWNATALKVVSWSATENAEPLNTTDKGSGGYRELIPGIKSLDIDVKAQWDSSINEGNPPLVRAGLTPLLTLEMQDGDDGFAVNALVVSVDYTSETEGVIEYGFKAQSTGSYHLPGEGGS